MHVLFICTGNIFRSLTAEYALRAALSDGSDIVVSSAGTEDYPHVVWPVVRDYLHAKGLDVSRHARRTLTPQILQTADVAVAMSTDHQEFVRTRLKRNIPLFTEACGLTPAPLLDVGEAVPDYASNLDVGYAHMRGIMDTIIELSPKFADRLLGRNETLR
jgi:protein-tyrosine phosphatase